MMPVWCWCLMVSCGQLEGWWCLSAAMHVPGREQEAATAERMRTCGVVMWLRSKRRGPPCVLVVGMCGVVTRAVSGYATELARECLHHAGNAPGS